MFVRRSWLFAALLLAGCGAKTDTGGDAAAQGPGTAGSPEAATPATAPQSGLQTVDGDGFSIQAPAGWMVLRVPNGLAVSSPNDFANEIPGIPVSFAKIAVPAPLVPADMAGTLLAGNKGPGAVIVSESQLTIGGRQGTRLETTQTHRVNDTSDETSTTRSVFFYVPVDAAVLIVQAVGPDRYVSPLVPQIDAIITSLTFR